MLGFRTLRPIAARAFRPALVQPRAYPLVTFIPHKSFHEFSEAGTDHHSLDPESSGTTKKLGKIMGPMHNHVIVKEFKDLRESTKELKLDLRESIKESGLELKEEMQEFRREANIWMRWLLGTYLGAVLVMLYYDWKVQNEREEPWEKFIGEIKEMVNAWKSSYPRGQEKSRR